MFRTGRVTAGASGGRANGLGDSQWHYSNFKRRYWDKAVKAANLNRQPTPHWLRHTAVVWLHNAGATMPELQRRIGHASIGTTMGVYGRAIEDVSSDALVRFDQMLTGVSAIPTGQAHATLRIGPKG
jgi:integrase